MPAIPRQMPGYSFGTGSGNYSIHRNGFYEKTGCEKTAVSIDCCFCPPENSHKSWKGRDMRFLIQRVSEASVTIDGKVAGAIDQGFCVLIGVSEEDTKETADLMVRKMLGLRIFQDENEKTNLSLADVGGSLLLISQFTLYADCRKGNRPSFIKAGSPDKANELYEYIIEKCRESGRPVERGVFGAYMKISLVNDGPFTVMLDSEDLKRPKAGAGGR